MPDRAIDVLNFIVEFKAANDGIAPSMTEIIGVTDITTNSLVKRYLEKLESAGRIRILRDAEGRQVARGIIVEGGTWTPPAHLQLSD